MKYDSRFFVALMILLGVSCIGKEVQDKKTEVLEEGSTATLPYFNSAVFTPEWNQPRHKIPAFSFTNQNGETVTNNTFEGTMYVADFFFTVCPGICPKLTKHMQLLQDEYRGDLSVKLLSHSVMPWHDTVEKLADYAKEYSVGLPQWHLVTGDTDAIYTIARNGYFADEDFGKTQGESDFIHTENFILVDKEGYIRGVYNGTLALEVKRLMRHITILKQER